MRGWAHVAAVAAASVLLLGRAGSAAAQAGLGEGDRLAVAGGVEVYTDTDHTTVVTVAADSAIQTGDHLQLQPHVVIDAVTSASVDVISAATESFSGARGELGLAAAFKRIDDETVRLEGVVSAEEDWTSQSVRLSWRRELLRRNLGLGVAVATTHNTVGDARHERGRRDFSETLWGHTWQLEVSQLLAPRTRLAVAQTGQVALGYQASPYRHVDFTDGMTLDEVHPDRRVRLSLGATLNHYLGHDVGVVASYRVYGDSWSVWSHTVALAAMLDLGDALSLQLRGRAYTQGHAEFYQETYASPTGLEAFSTDKELASMWNAGGGGALIWRPWETVSVAARAEAIYYRYRDFAPLPDMTALILGGTVGVTR
ncbi:MAG: DUF3570 domain-containing protein [Kofleriaceae bacterium]|jgi:hypothetical protein|nr:DUF3570 domain-containing protein [Kofleriaceae bacterium]